MRWNRIGTAIAAWALISGCASNETPAPATTEASSAPTRGRKEIVAATSSLDLKGMLSPVPEYEGQGRNLFAYGPERRAAGPATPRPEMTTTPSAPLGPTTSVPRALAPRTAARIRVKYAGFVEKTEPSGNKSKYAIFLDGNEILAGAEGETVASLFTVVEIGLESVTVSAKGSNATQRIPLQAN